MTIFRLGFVISILIISQFFSCGTEFYTPNMEVEGAYGYNFIDSQKQWLSLRHKNQNSYKYTVSEESVTGFGSNTLIQVVRGEVMGRNYEEYLVSQEDGSKEIIFVYAETDKDLGTHTKGAAPVVLDTLYKDCGLKFLQVDPQTHEIFFDTNKEGVIALCGNVPELCADDCFQGFRISAFEWSDGNTDRD